MLSSALPRAKSFSAGLWLIGSVSLLLTLFCGTLPAAESSLLPRSVITSAAEFDYPPFSLVSETGEATGFSVELLEASLAAMGHEVTFNVGPWPEVKQSLVDRRIQVLPLVGRTPEREAVFDFTFPYLSMHGTLIVRDDEQGIHGLSDLQGRTVAVLKGDNAEEFLRRSNLGAKIVTTGSFETALRDLSLGQYDAVIIQKLLATQLIQKNRIQNLRSVGPPLTEFTQSFCFAVPKGDFELLSLLNEGLSIVIADGTFQALRTKWFADLSSFNKSRILVGGDKNYPPYEYLDENGQPAGFNVDLTRAIAKQLGLEVHIQLDAWNKVRDGLQNGQIDLIEGMFYSPERDKVVDFSSAHSIVSHAIVTRKGEAAPQNLQELKGKSILLMAGDIMHDIAIREGYEKQLVAVETQEDALRLLAEGEGDCVLVARIPALYWIKKHGWNNLVVGSQSVFSPEHSYAALPDNAILLDRFSEALEVLRRNGEYREIYAKWFSVYEPSGTDPKIILKYILLSVTPIILLLVGVVIWNKSLKREVRARTAELVTEIDERKKTESILRSEEKKFRTLFEHVSDYALVLRKDEDDLIIADLSESACRLHGYQVEELIGQSINLLDANGVDVEHLEAQFALLSDGKTLRLEVSHRRKDGSVFPVEVLSRMIEIEGSHFIYSIERDMTEQKLAEQARAELEEQLLQKYKMQALDDMAGGMAHNFNNNLAIIIGNVQLAKLKVSETRALENLDQALIAAKRGTELIQQVMTYSRRGVHEKTPLQLATIIDETLKLLRSTIPTTVEVQADVPTESLALTVKADASRIQEALINLCNNAVHAMDEKGILTLSLDTVELRRWNIPAQYECSPGTYARLSVQDNGCGMRDEILAKIFDPFFTTKEVGAGTGIGLSTVQGIMKQHHGLIKVLSEPGQGSRFELYFPLVDQVLPESSPSNSELPGGSEKILLIDDEEMLVELGGETLAEMGYQVTTETSSVQALETFSLEPNRFDLVITDQTMPKLTGKELIQKLHKIRSDLPVILCTGHASSFTQEEASQLGISAYFMKPVEMPQLLQTVRKVLDEKSHP